MNRPGPTRNIVESIVIAFVLTGLSYYVGLQAGWIHSLSSFNDWLEIFAVWTSYSCTWLCVVERRINYPIGAISSVAYAWLFINSGLVASAILNIYLVPTLVYGWIRWHKDITTRPVTHVKVKHVWIYLLASGLLYLGAVVLNHWFGGTMAFTDGVIFAGSILAQFLLDNKKLENWIVWLVVDIIAVWEYFKVGLPLVGFQYILFLINTLVGFIAWYRSMHNVKSVRPNDGYAANDGSLAANPVC